MKLFGGIEAGGTKFVCGVGTTNFEIKERVVIPTTTPEETIQQVVAYFRGVEKKTPISAVGVAAFGPIDLHPFSPSYGHILATPKPGWGGFDFIGTMKRALDLPVGFDTDVNGAALGEYRWGSGQGLQKFIYITVGTGIGAGGISGGDLMHGLLHPEMGHIFIPHDIKVDPFEGVCPFHKDCLEGLASGPSMNARWGVESSSELPVDHKAWELESHYLALAVANYIMILSPQRVIMGGGVMKQTQLFPLIRKKVVTLLQGYIKHRKLLKDIDRYIVPPGLGDDAGLAGAIQLAEFAHHECPI